ncbi:MAG: DUF1538 domain-containing protein [Actinomycetota bacterium]|nr:DUF1538 domain-containing protein [Actinomycetota bacterium]
MSEIFVPSILLNLIIEVSIALVPIFVIFVVFQLLVLKIARKTFKNILKGFLLTFIGLVLFLYGVQIGFMPAGTIIGETIGSSSYRWILIPIGFLLGFVVTVVEPAVRILCSQVENSSSGYLKEKAMLYILSIGVAAAVALAMAKIVFEIPLIFILLPGYTLAFILAFIAGPRFTSLAFDSGGVATGPMTVTFILSISLGAAAVMEGRDTILHGFGLVSIVALAPIIAILIFGIIFQRKGGNLE